MQTSLHIVPSSPRRTAYMLVGSVLLHGSIIAVAAMWPVRYAPPEEPGVTQIFDAYPPDSGVQLPPAAAASVSIPPLEEAVPPPPVAVPDDAPPPVEESFTMDLTPPKPAVSKVRPSHPSAANTSRAEPARSGVSGDSNAARNATGTATNAGKPGTAGGRWNLAQPVYPPRMRAAHVQGSGSVRITTDGAGRVVDVNVMQSTGNAVLDDNTGSFARMHWSGPPNTSTTVPITYQLR